MSSSTPISEPLLIRRPRILMPDGEFLTGDVLMAGGKIDRVEPEIEIASDGEGKEIDAAGLTLLPGVETCRPLMLAQAMQGRCTVAQVSNWMSTAVAKAYNIPNKGAIAPDYDADLFWWI